jgi:hypothetical protein
MEQSQEKINVEFIPEKGKEIDTIKITMSPKLIKILEKVVCEGETFIGNFKRSKIKTSIASKYVGYELIVFNTELLKKGTTNFVGTLENYRRITEALKSPAFKNMLNDIINYNQKTFNINVEVKKR